VRPESAEAIRQALARIAA